MFLFLLLKHFNINFIAAHVDHGWRKTSYEEALFLKEFSEKERVPFSLYQVEKSLIASNNSEDKATVLAKTWFSVVSHTIKI